jgi:chromosome segregation ATPase
VTLRSEDVTRDIEALEHNISNLRARVEDDKSNYSTLEAQVSELKENLERTLGAVKENELRLAEKQVELAQAKREEAAAAYQEALESRREAADRVKQKAEDLLSEMDAYDGETLSVRRLMEDMHGMRGFEEEAAEIAAALAQEPADLRQAWERLVGAIKWRLETNFQEDLVDPDWAENLPDDLQDAASARRRIKEYFAKD